MDLKRSRRISNASAQDQSAQTNIQDALNALSEAEARIPEKYRKKYRQTSLIPEFPNFQALDELAARINDGSFGGAIKRLTGIGGYTSMMDMVNDYLDHVEAGRMYLRGEQKKSSSYLAQEKASANAEYIREKAVVEQKKAKVPRMTHDARSDVLNHHPHANFLKRIIHKCICIVIPFVKQCSVFGIDMKSSVAFAKDCR